MSSESSTSSIRQFGLYRTIDARTEEFLRLSRRRQLRQGCICAAISTAITVTVVIIIILVYDYSNVTNAYSTKSDWLGLMNKSDHLQFDPTYKAKFKLDRTTIQLLPVLLKAFSMNKYYDPDSDDSSSTNPNNYVEGTTEKMHKNIFADTRNWMKMPTSRVYAIELKTSPIVYFKNPTRNLDYFRKIRKIRDYERVMNYVDKMINDKVTSGSVQPMLRTEYNVKEKSFLKTATPPIPKWYIQKSYSTSNYNEYKSKNKDAIKPKNLQVCSCTTKISLLIQKLIISLQKIMPEFANSKEKNLKNFATHMKNTATATGETIRDINNLKSNPSKIKSLPIFNKQNKGYNDIPKTNIKSDTNSKNKPSENKYNDIALSNILRLLKPNIKYFNRNNNIYNNVSKTLRKEVSNISNIKNQSESAIFFGNKGNSISNKGNTVQKYKNNSYATKQYNIFAISNISTASSIVIDDDYGDFTQTDPNDLSNMINLLDTHTLELVKNNIISTKSHNSVQSTLPIIQKRLTTEIHVSNVFSVTEAALVFKEYNNKKDEEYAIDMNSFDNNLQTSHNNTLLVLNLNKTDTINNSAFYSIEELMMYSESKYRSTGKPDNKKNTLSDETHLDEVLERENDRLEEEIEKSTNEESNNEDEHIKDMENIINSLRSNNRHKIESTNSSDLYYWEFIKIQEHAKNITKTILSQNRPTYLEMQRNNWKHEENKNIVEYDANLNNYIFD